MDSSVRDDRYDSARRDRFYPLRHCRVGNRLGNRAARRKRNTSADKIGWKKYDEERLLLTISQECRAQERAAADQLLRRRQNLFYPASMRLVDAYQAIRIECRKKGVAVRMYRKKMREELK